MSLDMRRQSEGVLPGEVFRQFRIAPLQSVDDFQVIDDGLGRAAVLRDGQPMNGAHVRKYIARRVADGLRPSQRNDGAVKRDIGIGVRAQTLGGRRIRKLVEQMPQPGNVRVRGANRGKPRRHGLECGPHLDHFDDFAL